MQSEDAVLPTTISGSTACVKRSDALTKNFIRPAHSVSCRDEKIVLTIKDCVWEKNLKFVEDIPTIYVIFFRSVITVSKKKKYITFAPPLVDKCT
jgi:hypothetical protein